MSGDILSVYDNSSGTLLQTEMPIYGMSRLGEVRKNSGVVSSVYELTDHLGSVRATIKRIKVSGPDGMQAEIDSWSDYYADGEVMRTGTGQYRFGYQGQFAERDETNLNSFDLRAFDTKIGRWISPDPYAQYHSPYMAMGNNPVSYIDPDGGFSVQPPTIPMSSGYGSSPSPSTGNAGSPIYSGPGNIGGGGYSSGESGFDMNGIAMAHSRPSAAQAAELANQLEKARTAVMIAAMQGAINKANKGDGTVYNAEGTQNVTASNGMNGGEMGNSTIDYLNQYFYNQRNADRYTLAGPGDGDNKSFMDQLWELDRVANEWCYQAGLFLADITGAKAAGDIVSYNMYGVDIENKKTTPASLATNAALSFVPVKAVKIVKPVGALKYVSKAITKLSPYKLEMTHGLTKSKSAFTKLKADIKLNGIKEPIKFVEHNGKRYVVDGHHRLRAAKELNIQDVPVQQVELPYGSYKSAIDLIYSPY